MKQYHIYNTSRDPRTRLKRYQAPSHRGMTQRVGIRRVVRGRPTVVSEETLLANLELFKKKVTAGYIQVTTPDGRPVSLDTMEAAPKQPAPPKPSWVEDSVVNDKPSGVKTPIYPDGAVQSTAADKKAAEAAAAVVDIEVDEEVDVDDEVEVTATEDPTE